MASQLRPPTLNERRCILRHEFGYYHGLVNAAVYSFPGVQPSDYESCLKLLGPALQQCIEQHPIMGVVIDNPGSEDTTFRRSAELPLRQHVHLLKPSALREKGDEANGHLEISTIILEKERISVRGAPTSRRRALLETVLEEIVNMPFPDVTQTPPWRLFVIPLDDEGTADDQHTRLLLVYNYSHSHGDGLSGLVFHRAFLLALRSIVNQGAEPPALTVLKTVSSPLPTPPGPWPLSWSYFLGVLTKEFAPWLPKLLFWRAGQPGPPWTGRDVFFERETFRAGVRLITVDVVDLKAALTRCKAHRIKLTGLLHLLIVRGLHMTLSEREIAHEAFKGTTPVDLRKVFGLSADEMHNSATAISHTFSLPDDTETITEKELQCARELGDRLVQCSSTTHDQVVGLLKYAVPIGGWIKGKIGKARSDTYELSNTMSFDPESAVEEGDELGHARVDIESICWTQSADVVGQVFSANVVSLKGGNLSIAITWQYGALGVVEGDAHATAAAEIEFMNDLSSAIEREFVRWANNATR